MKNFFKKMAIVFIAVTMSVAANAQFKQGDFAIGANGLLGFGDSFTNYGIGAKATYNLTDPIRLAGAFDYFLKKNELGMWGAMVFGHYLFSVAETIAIYPAAGLGIVGSSVSSVDFGEWGSYGGGSTSDFAFSLGAGIDIALSESLVLNAEFKTWLKNGTRMIISLGLAYKF
ncbi:MAG: porin family protein [Bacteroidales bacterium]|nr:porin family protein [Bacteroidales bacterium]MCL2133652.1 porin family protein [Bacteroidales bacterium]